MYVVRGGGWFTSALTAASGSITLLRRVPGRVARPRRHSVSGHNFVDGRLTTLARPPPSHEARRELVLVRSSGVGGGAGREKGEGVRLLQAGTLAAAGEALQSFLVH
ncbi:hypothetical protein E2C01_084686 [Portunus trituberculatus]|uniref:Uncharacterized protein n=1 Tax=Portunus trituberculatus TaxID=210409 RepID=A0A5B7J8E0_PORTR|nr:hypothetical protein [Portunus trituberculatus]